MHLPVEFMIIGTAITLRKRVVTSKEVSNYIEKCTLPLDWDSENKLYYCAYNEDDDTYTIQDNLSLPPQIIQILTSF